MSTVKIIYTVAMSALLLSGTVRAQQGADSVRKQLPEAFVGGKYAGKMSASVFRIQIGPVASLRGLKRLPNPGERYMITYFTFGIVTKRGTTVGPFVINNPYGARFSDNKVVADAMEHLVPGDKVFIREIKAVGNKGPINNLNSIELLMN